VCCITVHGRKKITIDIGEEKTNVEKQQWLPGSDSLGSRKQYHPERKKQQAEAARKQEETP
jgi:hypothetical protein